MRREASVTATSVPAHAFPSKKSVAAFMSVSGPVAASFPVSVNVTFEARHSPTSPTSDMRKTSAFVAMSVSVAGAPEFVTVV